MILWMLGRFTNVWKHNLILKIMTPHSVTVFIRYIAVSQDRAKGQELCDFQVTFENEIATVDLTLKNFTFFPG